MQKTVHLATKLVSFQSARDSVAEALEVELTTKRVERLAKRIGGERVAQRELSIAEWKALTTVAKLAAPKGTKAPEVVCISIWQREFKHQGYIAILDFIHALTYVFSAAMAGRSRAAGEPIYRRWITCIWQGQVQQVIAEVAARAAELGPLLPDASTTDPRQIVADTLTYLTNQQSRMNYPAYRQAGLPITSSPIESTVKQINHLVKGSEKFWSAFGGEALLQLRADQLSDTAPLDLFWTNRTRQATGLRNYKKTTTTSA